VNVKCGDLTLDLLLSAKAYKENISVAEIKEIISRYGL